MTVFAPSLGGIWEQLESYGLDPGPVFRAHGIDPGTMSDAGARISRKQFQQLDTEAARLSGDPLFGIKSSNFYRPAHMGALGFAWLASPDLRTAVSRLGRYIRLVQTDLELHVADCEEGLRITIKSESPELYDELGEDGQLSCLLKMCRMVAGEEFSPAQVCFRKANPPESGFYYELFRCPIEFESSDTEFTIKLSDANRSLTGGNEELAHLNEHIVVKYLAHHDQKDIVNQVKALIIDGLAAGEVSEQIVADGIYMTARNMHRRLTGEGTTFKMLLNEIRQDLARQYIQDRSKTLTEIAFLLGFSEVSSFSRAFKSWNGIPPSQARNESA